jgi:hypothetical protein
MSRVDINRPSEIGSASQFGEPPFEVQGLGSLRFAVPAKRKTALRRPFAMSNLETPSYAMTPSSRDFPLLRRNAA